MEKDLSDLVSFFEATQLFKLSALQCGTLVVKKEETPQDLLDRFVESAIAEDGMIKVVLHWTNFEDLKTLKRILK